MSTESLFPKFPAPRLPTEAEKASGTALPAPPDEKRAYVPAAGRGIQPAPITAFEARTVDGAGGTVNAQAYPAAGAHSCIACPNEVRDLFAVATNVCVNDPREGVPNWQRFWDKIDELACSVERLRPFMDAHFAERSPPTTLPPHPEPTKKAGAHGCTARTWADDGGEVFCGVEGPHKEHRAGPWVWTDTYLGTITLPPQCGHKSEGFVCTRRGAHPGEPHTQHVDGELVESWVSDPSDWPNGGAK